MLNQTVYLSYLKLLNTWKEENRVHMTIGRILKIFKHFRSTISKTGVLPIIIFIKLGNEIKFWNAIAL